MSDGGRGTKAPPYAQGVYDMDDIRSIVQESEERILAYIDRRFCQTDKKVEELDAKVDKHSQKFAHEEGVNEARRDARDVVQRWLGWFVAAATVAVSIFHPHIG